MRLITGRLAARLPALAFLLLGLLCAAPAPAQDTDNLLPVTEAYKLSADTATPGMLKLHWTIAPDYYLYRGRMKFKGGDGVTLGEAQLPDGEKHHDEYLGDVETYHHGVDASIPYSVAAGTTRLQLSVQYQGCHEVDPKICYPPHTEKLDLPLPASAGVAATPTTGNALGAALSQLGSRTGTAAAGAPLPAEQAFRFEALAQGPQQLLLRWTMPKGYYLYRDQTTLKLGDAAGLTLKPAWPAGTAHRDEHYGDVTVYFDQVELPVTVEGDLAGRRQLALQASFQGCQDGGLCYPLMTRAVDIDLGSGAVASGAVAPEMPPADLAGGPLQVSLVAALLLALGGGLVLNLMPCVLPVLSIKAVSVLESGENRATARRHALFYTAGVLCSFATLGLGILALRAAGHALGWGSQLQQPLLVGALACVMLAVGLSMSGVVQFGASLGNTGAGLAARSGPAGDFFTGVLAVVVASPCTAPFMGGALAYAFAAPMLSALLVFLMLGVGLALPFLAVGFVPALARLLPKPGRWMETLKQVLAFPMYLTAAWLVWVLANQRGADAVGLVLVAMVLLAMTLWWFERSRSRGAPSKLMVAVLALATLVPMYLLAHVPPPSNTAVAEEGVVAYSPQKLAELRAAGTPVFVDMTADWCVTCKANEHAVLGTQAFRDLLQRTGAVYMKGDWTDVNPTISEFLQAYHSPGVPLYVVFPKHGGPGRKLSTVLTAALVEQALTEAAR
ncbi:MULTISPECIES: protein-disulfide reductase DsbD family protein [unclassified Rhodanobacter]|uniref:protein-disulfide reductase DsbD family protein n=1 Tax=unclassified Rhodanobacter TaxID=2621553 RepID=UPI0007AA1AC4|nr:MULTISPECIES: protein-disulfide reductase DsbD [unclassified Rhodanobacter]KZC17994.1 protein-disulfide reductase [Rhodanobacter sp. FW104-R8]KZC28173.1 protein-disulfide reductase [Rhodanobacter sp. FW510-T8]KZC33373.1 protein-disulfide reductase [Rhodanobacter sp. FW510-R10]